MKGSTSSAYTPSQRSGISCFLNSKVKTEPLMDDDALQFHWRTFPAGTKQFILSTLGNLSLNKFVEFWSAHPNFTTGSIAGSIYGASWFLGLIYLKRGDLITARALTLNGCFLQECYVS